MKANHPRDALAEEETWSHYQNSPLQQKPPYYLNNILYAG